MRTFITIWIGQLVSMFGSALTSFGLGVWVFQKSQSATLFALILLCTMLPSILLGPFAGTLVDRYDRRRVMVVSNAALASVVVVLAALLSMGLLRIWHVYVATTLITILTTLLLPAFEASVTLLVRKDDLARANGLTQLSEGTAQILAPLVAGFVLAVMPVYALLLVDLSTYLVAIGTLLLVRIPRPESVGSGSASLGLLTSLRQGWRCIAVWPGLVTLLAFAAAVNFALAVNEVLITPRVLSIASVKALGFVSAAAGAGTMVGSVLMTVWGGPRRRVAGVIGPWMLFGACLVLVGTRADVAIIAASLFTFYCASPVVVGCYLAIWQTKTPSHMQGRVLAIVRACSFAPVPLAYVSAGLVADRILDPLLSSPGVAPTLLARFIDIGPGAGAGLLIAGMGALTVVLAVTGRLTPRLWHLEDTVPDAAGIA